MPAIRTAIKKVAWVLFLLSTLPLEAAEKFTRTQLLMGDVPVSITIEATTLKRETAFRAMEKAFGEAQRIEEEVSEFRLTSQTSRLNQNAGRHLVPIGPDLTEILLKANEVSQATEGAFDITFPSPCHRRRGRFQTCPYTYRDVLVIPELGLAALRPGVRIAVSGIAKGYIVDRIAAGLRDAGFRKFLINAGDIYASGRWEVGIRDPQNPDGPPICRLKVKDQAVSTSGAYERGPHIIDPRTRLPVRSLKGVTVVAPDSMTADALATALFVLDRGKSEAILRSHTDLSAVFVDPQRRLGMLGKVSVTCRGVRGNKTEQNSPPPIFPSPSRPRFMK